jgi:hypothetical protein
MATERDPEVAAGFTPEPAPPHGSDLKNDLPTGWTLEPATETGLIDNLTQLVRGSINPALSSARTGGTNLIENILTSPPAVKEAFGPLGGPVFRGTAEMINPIPGSVGDVARDAALLTIPGGTLAKTALRTAAGTAGAAGGAYLGGEDPLKAAITTAPLVGAGEVGGLLSRNVGRAGRQQTADVGDVTAALNRTLKGQTVAPDVPSLYKSAAGGEIRRQAQDRYRSDLEEIATKKNLAGNRPFAIIPAIDPNRPVTFEQATNFLAGLSDRGPYQGKDAIGARQALRQAREVRQQIVDALDQGSPAFRRPPHPDAAALFQQSTQDYFHNRTVERLLKAPGVLDDTGQLNMQKLQEAFKLQMSKGQIPESESANLQAAIFRGAEPPATDQPMRIGPLRAAGAAAGLVGGGAVGHPYMGMHLADRLLSGAGTKYVGKTVQPGFLRRLTLPVVGSQAAQASQPAVSE